ncbi:MAG TPA: primary-amine oxidase [Casimicrobiaceae bacterium]|nr:primary-amine oxidase [Casimicrobiaceae bacterium]
MPEPLLLLRANQMRTFRIYAHPKQPVPMVVKVGWSWPAFIFGPLVMLGRACSSSRFSVALCLLIVGSATPLCAAPEDTLHPLDPLTAKEITLAADTLKAQAAFPKDALFSTIALREPPKQEVLDFKPGTAFRREALAIVMDRANNKVFEAVIDLEAGRVSSWKEIPGVQPLVFVVENDVLVPQIVKADPRWQEAMHKRGITDFDKVWVDTWAVGQVAGQPSGRLLRAVTYYKDRSANYYGRPVEGVVALVNMNTGKVVDLIDSGAVPLPPPSQDLDEESIGAQRVAPRPLVTTQPQGSSVEIHGNEVRWQNWRFRYSFQPREGLVLHTIGYEDGGRVRPILYRGSLSEMVVPYGDTDINWRWRSAFDVGEYGVGRLASPLESGQDAPDYATLLDVVMADDFGTPFYLKHAIGLYERDGGILWKHFDSITTQNQTRRARELVVFFVATIGNYDYAINWIFHQDGVLEVDCALTGIMQAKGVDMTTVAGESKPDQHADHLIAEHLVAPHHQHFFSFRLDLDIDGVNNSVAEINTRAAAAGPDNPSLNGMVTEETVFHSERGAQRRINTESARAWRVMNPALQNSLGQHPSYILVPGANAVPYIAPESQVRRRARFVDNHVWVTRYRASERYAAGDYPNQSTGGEGLPRWVANDEPIENEDVVLWYTMGITHIPRPEEWPVMPVSHIGFKLVPAGFFNRNPSLDVPR